MCAAGKATFSSLFVGNRGVADSFGQRPRLVLYGRKYCHLCDDMIATLDALRRELAFEIDVVDVDADPSLESRYNELVPLLMYRERELARWRLDPESLRAHLAEIG